MMDDERIIVIVHNFSAKCDKFIRNQIGYSLHIGGRCCADRCYCLGRESGPF